MKHILTLLLALSPVSGSAVAGPSAATHCLAGEKAIYSCRFSRNVASVCTTPTRVSYRYGPPSRPNLRVDSDGLDGKVHVGSVVGGGGGRAVNLRFTEGERHYVVHSGIAGRLTDVPGQTFSGVTVIEGADPEGRSVADLSCRSKGPLQNRLRSDVPQFVPSEPDDRWDAWY